MGNCIVTKLNGTVNNSSLKKLGHVVYELKNPSTEAFYILGASKGGVIAEIRGAKFDSGHYGTQVIDDTHISVGTNTTNNPTFEIKDIESANVEVEVYDKNSITQIGYSIINLKDFDYSNLISIYNSTLFGHTSILTKFVDLSVLQSSGGNLTGNISNLSGLTDLIRLSIVDANITGNISSLSGLINLTELDLGNCPEVHGDIAALGTLTSLNKLNLWHGSTIINQYSGSLESFVAAQRANGRTVNSTGISGIYGLDGVTFNGSLIAYKLNRVLTWTADTITFDGVTVNA